MSTDDKIELAATASSSELSPIKERANALTQRTSRDLLADIVPAKAVSTLGYKEHCLDVNGVAITPDGRYALTAGSDQIILIWDCSSKRCVGELRGHTGSIQHLAITPNGRLVVNADELSSI